jgi:hypothetical protein
VGPTAANLLFGFANIGCTAFASPLLPVHDLLVAINPLPGGIAGWYAIASAHRINLFTPYAALGELGNHGWLVLVGYCLVVGAILGHLDNSVRQLLAGGRQAYGLALLALAGLFMVISTQYNLRTATRLMYYALAADVAIRLWLRFGPERFRS